jgi:outer membrane protein
MEGDGMQLRQTMGAAVLAVCGLSGSVFAQAPAAKPADAPAKIAVVQFQPAVTATNEFQRDFGELQKKFEPKRTELKNLSDEIDRLTKELQTGGAKLSEAEQATRARTIDAKKKQVQRLAEDDQNEYEQAVQEAFNRVAAKVGDELTKYATAHGYTLVVDRSERQDQTPVVLWASASIDITQPVVDAYNAKSGVPAPSAAAPPAAPKPAAPR